MTGAQRLSTHSRESQHGRFPSLPHVFPAPEHVPSQSPRLQNSSAQHCWVSVHSPPVSMHAIGEQTPSTHSNPPVQSISAVHWAMQTCPTQSRSVQQFSVSVHSPPSIWHSPTISTQMLSSQVKPSAQSSVVVQGSWARAFAGPFPTNAIPSPAASPFSTLRREAPLPSLRVKSSNPRPSIAHLPYRFER